MNRLNKVLIFSCLKTLRHDPLCWSSARMRTALSVWIWRIRTIFYFWWIALHWMPIPHVRLKKRKVFYAVESAIITYLLKPSASAMLTKSVKTQEWLVSSIRNVLMDNFLTFNAAKSHRQNLINLPLCAVIKPRKWSWNGHIKIHQPILTFDSATKLRRVTDPQLTTTAGSALTYRIYVGPIRWM